MLKKSQSKKQKPSKSKVSDKLFTPLNQKEQQTTSGGWGWKGYW